MRKPLLAASLLALTLSAPAMAQSAAPAAAPAAPAAVPAGKLGDAVTPSAYRLDLTVDPDKERFSGHVEIDAALKQPAASLFLHGRDLAITRATATVGGKVLTGSWTQGDESGTGTLTFAEPLPAGPLTFAFDYDAPFQSGPAGMFRVKVGDDWYSWTQFESIDARAAFPSFDEPGFKTPFTVTLRTRPGQVAVSNAPEMSKTLENGLEVHRFAQTLPLPTYLVAMMVGPFATLEGTVPPTPQRAKPLPLRVVSTRQNAGKLAFALEGSKGIVAHLENYFGQSFPYPKLDQITSPIMPGAMENAGADVYNDSLLVMDDKASVEQKRGFGMVVSHELAHQWFGDLVTPAWWDDIWLNESFANWMGFRIGGEWRPDLNIGAGGLGEGFAAMGTDALVVGRPIHQKIEKNAQIDAAFDTITYGKGGHVIAMIAGFMGDTKFRDGVQRYMAAHRYGNATTADFFGAMAEVSGDPRLLPAMQSFTDQQGVPLLTFSGGAGGRYTVTQSRYARLGTTPPATHWGVPLCVRKNAARSCMLLDQTSGTVTVRGAGALIPNAGGTGYYRFELPRADWDRLIAVADKLPGGEALALTDSLRASFQAGRADAAQLATLGRIMARNPDSHASAAAITLLGQIGGGDLLDEAASKALRTYVGNLARPLLAPLGFDPRAGAYAGEAAEKSQRRTLLVGTMAETVRDEALRKQLGDAAAAYLGGNAAALDPAWFGRALAVHVENGGLDAAKALLDKALASQDSLFRPAALDALAGSGSEEVARWLLDDVKDQRLRLSERLGLVRGVVTAQKTRDFGFTWIRGHLDQLLSGGGGIFFASRLPQMLSGYCSADRAAEIDRDLGPRLAGKTGELELNRTVERVRSCGTLNAARRAESSALIARLK
ncbi:MAG: M1 family metallopeptidase [Sphingomonadales bacterium]|nr:M1 family metallopeptidase [Sphingomonadales bacterium]